MGAWILLPLYLFAVLWYASKLRHQVRKRTNVSAGETLWNRKFRAKEMVVLVGLLCPLFFVVVDALTGIATAASYIPVVSAVVKKLEVITSSLTILLSAWAALR